MSNPLLYTLRLVQFNRWFTPVFTFLWLSGMTILIVFEKLPKEFQSSNPTPFVVQFALGIVLIFALICAFLSLPSYMVFTRLESLVRKKISNPALVFSDQYEAKTIPFWLWIHFAYNVVIAAVVDINTNSPRLSSLPEWIQSNALRKAAISISSASEWFSWLTISLEHGMPLFYLVVFLGALKLEAHNLRMKAELEEVV